MPMNAFKMFQEAESDEQLAELRSWFERIGYAEFRSFLYQFEDLIKSFSDGQDGAMQALVAKARKAMPDPGAISPSWERIWDKLDRMIANKVKALRAVPPEERDGEWQILIDNPYTNREVACYPGLTFAEAAFIYARFRDELDNNEYVRLQKIVTHLTEFGGDRS